MSTAFSGFGDIISQVQQGIRNPGGAANVFLSRFLNVGIGLLLNGSIQVEKLQTLPRATLYNPELLICDFSGPCYWYSEGFSGNSWKWVPNLPDTLQVISATQMLALPTRPPFVFLHVSGSPGDNLVSATIGCQRDIGILQFQFWKTPEVAIRVCQMDEYGLQPYHCEDLQLIDVAGTAVAIIPEQLNPFRLAISSVGEGFISIDAIRYAGVFCKEGESGSNTKSPFMPITSLTGVENTIVSEDIQLPAIVHFATGLPTVDNYFSSDPIWCQHGDGQLILKFWTTTGASIQVCTSQFITGDPIYCSAPLNSSHAEYPGPVAINFMGDVEMPFEIKIFAVYPTGLATDENQIPDFDYVVVDDLAYFGDVCKPPALDITTTTKSDSSSAATSSNTTARATTTTTTTTTMSTTTTTTTTPKTTTTTSRSIPVKLVTAGWITEAPVSDGGILAWHNNRENYCGYRQGSFYHTTFWSRREVSFGRPLSRLTDIQTEAFTGYYLGALLKRNSVYSAAIIESPTFMINRISYLRFHVYSAGLSTSLRVCFDSQLDDTIDGRRYLSTLRRCRDVLKDVPVANLRKWNSVRVLMIPGFTKFFIVAQHTGTSNEYVAVGVDNITVSPCDADGITVA